MGEYRRLVARARTMEALVENPVYRSLEAAVDAKAKVMRFLGAEVTQAGSKVRGDFLLIIATAEDGSELAVHLEGNKLPAITSHVVYPPLESGEETSLYAGADDAVVHFLTGFSPYPQEHVEDEAVGGRAA